MRRITTLVVLVSGLAALAACSAQTQEKISSALQTAAPTIEAVAGTKVASAIGTAGPTIEAAAQAVGTQVTSAMGTAGPTLEAAGTTVAGAMSAAGFDPVTKATWVWTGSTMTDGPSAMPDDPTKYTVKFNADGTVEIQADCNHVGGTYTVDGSKLTIALGPATMAACPAGSMGDTFVQQLGDVASYTTDGVKLSLALKADTGMMGFAPTK